MEIGRPLRSFDVRVNAYRRSVILTRGRTIFELREVESFLWNLCDGARGIDDIARALSERYEVDEATADRDVREFIADLLEAELIELQR